MSSAGTSRESFKLSINAESEPGVSLANIKITLRVQLSSIRAIVNASWKIISQLYLYHRGIPTTLSLRNTYPNLFKFLCRIKNNLYSFF